MTISYQDISDGAIVLGNTTGVTRAVVKGIKSVTLPTLERSVTEVKELRNDFSRKFAGGASMGSLIYAGNFVLGDTLGQDELKARLRSKESFVDGRVYLNFVNSDPLASDFIAPDLANDPAPNGWQVVKHSPGAADVDNAIIPFDGEIVMNGQPAFFNVHHTASMTITKGTAQTEDTVLDGASGFVTAGFVAGMTLMFEGVNSGANEDHQYLIKTVAAGTLTLTTIGSTTAITPAASFTVHGGLL